MKKVCLSFFEKHTFFSALEITGLFRFVVIIP